jgi:hypothetical protein
MKKLAKLAAQIENTPWLKLALVAAMAAAVVASKNLLPTDIKEGDVGSV